MYLLLLSWYLRRSLWFSVEYWVSEVKWVKRCLCFSFYFIIFFCFNTIFSCTKKEEKKSVRCTPDTITRKTQCNQFKNQAKEVCVLGRYFIETKNKKNRKLRIIFPIFFLSWTSNFSLFTCITHFSVLIYFYILWHQFEWKVISKNNNSGR